jgi:uncharacterized lipoprotein YajG
MSNITRLRGASVLSDLSIGYLFASFAGSVRTFTVLFAISVLVTGCAGMKNVLITLPTYQTQLKEQKISSGLPVKIHVEPLKDLRGGAIGGLIGEKTTIGNKPMGNIEMNPIPTNILEQLLKSELSALGYKIVDSDEEFRIDAQLKKFKVVTPATALYWDVNGAINLNLAIVHRWGKVYNSRYTATCTDRTYMWPSEDIITGVVNDCLGKIAASLQDDKALASFLEAR